MKGSASDWVPAGGRPWALGLLVALAPACGGGFERTLDYRVRASAAMGGRALHFGVYTPPGFRSDERLPLVVFLHGGGDDHASFDRHQVSQRLNAAIASGRAPRVVIALPEGEFGFWANWYDRSARYEDWVMREVLPAVATAYHTQPCPDGCHVMGVSMGGSGTLRFALHHPWASATVISAPVLNTSEMINLVRNPLFVPLIPMDRIFGPTSDSSRVQRDDPFLRWQQASDLGSLRMMVAWGSRDREPIIRTSRRFHRHLVEHRIPHQALEFDGNHSWTSWGPVIEESLRRMVRTKGSSEAEAPSEGEARKASAPSSFRLSALASPGLDEKGRAPAR